MNDLAPYLANVDGYPPKLGVYSVLLLLYVDDAVIISRTHPSLKCLIDRCVEYLDKKKMQLNYNKSKIVVFVKSWNQLQWKLSRNSIKQVKQFKYLGLFPPTINISGFLTVNKS